MNGDQLFQSIAALGQYVRSTPEGRTVAHVRRADFPVVAENLAAQSKLPLDLFFATDDRAAGQGFGVHAVFAVDALQQWVEIVADLPADWPSYESLTRRVVAAHWYERYAQDMFGIRAEGHPDGRRLVHHENVPAGTHPLRKDFAWDTRLPHASEPCPMSRVLSHQRPSACGNTAR